MFLHMASMKQVNLSAHSISISSSKLCNSFNVIALTVVLLPMERQPDFAGVCIVAFFLTMCFDRFNNAPRKFHSFADLLITFL